MQPRKEIEGVTIKVVANGFALYIRDPEIQMIPMSDMYVFENFGALSEWLRKNLKSPDGQNE